MISFKTAILSLFVPLFASAQETPPVNIINQTITNRVLAEVQNHLNRHKTLSEVYDKVLRPRLKLDEQKKFDALFAQGAMPSASVEKVYSSLIVQIANKKHVITLDRAFPSLMISIDGINISPNALESRYKWITRIQSELQKNLFVQNQMPIFLRVFFESAEAIDSNNAAWAIYASGIALLTESQIAAIFNNKEFKSKEEIQVAQKMAEGSKVISKEQLPEPKWLAKVAAFKPLESLTCSEDSEVQIDGKKGLMSESKFKIGEKTLGIQVLSKTKDQKALQISQEGFNKTVHVIEYKDHAETTYTCENGKPLDTNCTPIPTNIDLALTPVSKKVLDAEKAVRETLKGIKVEKDGRILKSNRAYIDSVLQRVTEMQNNPWHGDGWKKDLIDFKGKLESLKDKHEISSQDLSKMLGDAPSIYTRFWSEEPKGGPAEEENIKREFSNLMNTVNLPPTCQYSLLGGKLFSSDEHCQDYVFKNVKTWSTPERKKFFIALQNYRNALYEQRREQGGYRYAEAIKVAQEITSCCRISTCREALTDSFKRARAAESGQAGTQ